MNSTTAQAGRSCDASLGPTASHCGAASRFDFTLAFQQSALSMVPYAILLSLAIPRVYRLFKVSRKVGGRSLHLLKLIPCVVFAALQLALLISWSVNHGPVATKLGIASSALGFTTALAMCALSWLEHERSVRPSTLLCVYLLISLMFDAAQCRTLWLLNRQPGQPMQALPPLFSALLASKIAMLLSESLGKSRHLLTPWKHLQACPEAIANIFSRGSFWWLNDLLIRGFRASLSLDTLYETDDQLQSAALLDEFRERVAKTQPSKYRLLFVIFGCLKASLIKSAIARLFLIAFRFTQPFLLQYVIEFVQNDKHGGEYRQDIAYSLIAATGLLSVGNAFADGFYKHHIYRGLTMVRGGLVSLICSNSLGVSAAVASEMASLTLIGPDVRVINGAFTGLHDIWANPIEIGLSTFLLYHKLGIGCVGPIATAIFCFILMSQLPKHMGPAIKAWNVAIEKRVSITSSVVGNIRETKMLGLSPVWLRYIQSLRAAELLESKRFRMYMTYMNVLGNFSPCIAPVLTFGIAMAKMHNDPNSQLSISTAFTSLSIIGLMMEPLSNLLFSLPNFVSSLGIFERVEKYIQQSNYHSTVASQSGLKMQSQNSSSTEEVELQRIPSNIIKLKDASFAAKVGEESVLHEIDLTIKPGDVLAVGGKVGSGKSLLLQALLGELSLEDGEAEIDVASYGYCSQSAWLFKGTIRDNIIAWTTGGFDERRYNTIIKACGLDKDFEQLAEGDLTQLASRGLSLSGGQRHRVALARALFAAPPVFVLDDIFSSWDQKTQKFVWEHVFGPSGLVHELGSAAVIATHSLPVIKQADSVIIMDKCRIVRHGPYTSDLDDDVFSQGATADDAEEPAKVDDTAADVPNAAAKKEEEVQKQIDDLMQSSGDSSLYWYYLKSIGWKYSLIGLSFSVTMEVCVILNTIWLKWWTEADAAGGSRHDLMYYGVYSAFLILAIVTIGFDCWFMFVMIVPRSAGKLHWNLLKAVMRAPMPFFASTTIGDLVNRFSQDMTLVDQDLPVAVYTSVKNALSVLGTGALVMLGSKYLACSIPVGFIILYVLQNFYLRTSRQLRLLQLQASAPLFGHLVETGEGLTTVRAFRWSAPAQDHAVALLDRSQRPSYLLYAIQRWLTFVLDMMVAGLGVLLVALSVVVRRSDTGSVAIALSSVLGFGRVLAGFVESWTQLETSLGAIARLKSFEETTPRETEKLGTCEPPAQWPAQGLLEIRNLSASYKAASPDDGDATPVSDNDDPVLRQLSITIQPGQKVAICGRTGSGKSSLLLTLYQLLRYSGTTTIDGVDISLVPTDTLRSRLITVPQEPLIFPGTIRFNLCPGTSSATAAALRNEDEDRRLLSALRKVSLDKAILAVEGGLDADVKDVSLSHGQKQLLCLARALLRRDDPEASSSGKVLVLDEATSSVDAETERMMVKIVEEEFADYTVLSVAHRLQSVRGFDRMLVLDKGSLVRVGTPAELIGEDGQLRD